MLLKDEARDREREREREVNTEQNVSGKLIYPRLLVQASRKKEICHRKQVRRVKYDERKLGSMLSISN